MPDQPNVEDLIPMLPGTGEIMASVGRCFGIAWHAAAAGNYDLAAYFVRRTRSLLRKLVLVRPKYAGQVSEFDRDHLEAVSQALTAGDAARFEAAYRRAVEQANAYHVETGHPYIGWRIPDLSPDPGLDLGSIPPRDA